MASLPWPVAVLPVPLAVLDAPVAALNRPLAVLSTPVATLPTPLAVAFTPHSVESSPAPSLHYDVGSAWAVVGSTSAATIARGVTAASSFTRVGRLLVQERLG